MTSYIISAPPSQGKSYISTLKAVELIKQGKIVFTNYPIIYSVPYTFFEKLKNLYRVWIQKKPFIPKKQLSTYKWFDYYIEMGLHDCTIFLDEAYKLVNCHTRLTDDQHDFFATTGHNNVDIYVIAQNYARINKVIREMATFIIISKFSNPLSLMSKNGRKQLTPLFFTVDTYLTERDYALKNAIKDALYDRKRVFFSKDIANAYNTQYYRKKEKPLRIVSWLDDMNNSVVTEEIKEKEMMKEFIES